MIAEIITIIGSIILVFLWLSERQKSIKVEAENKYLQKELEARSKNPINIDIQDNYVVLNKSVRLIFKDGKVFVTSSFNLKTAEDVEEK